MTKLFWDGSVPIYTVRGSLKEKIVTIKTLCKMHVTPIIPVQSLRKLLNVNFKWLIKMNRDLCLI